MEPAAPESNLSPEGPLALSVYIHFPWCLRKCPYCDFATRGIEAEAIPQRAYTDALLREIEMRAALLGEVRLVSIFFGGGTPSLWWPSELGRVLQALLARFGGAEEVEVSVECNPSSLDEAKIEALRSVGVNRLSIGVQSLESEGLVYLGRKHDAAQALSVLRTTARYFERFNADLMFGLPRQGPQAFLQQVVRLRDQGVPHFSAYALTIEQGTRFGELQRLGKLELAPPEGVAQTFLELSETLQAQGFSHYEVSNYALPGQECLHNQHYWRGGAYWGLGAGAVGCLPVGERQARRWRNHNEGERYIEAMATLALDAAPRDGIAAIEVESEILEPLDRMREGWMLGLRSAEGVDLAELAARTGLDVWALRQREIEKRVGFGDLVLEEGRLRVPARRWLHLDSTLRDLF